MKRVQFFKGFLFLLLFSGFCVATLFALIVYALPVCSAILHAQIGTGFVLAARVAALSVLFANLTFCFYLMGTNKTRNMLLSAVLLVPLILLVIFHLLFTLRGVTGLFLDIVSIPVSLTCLVNLIIFSIAEREDMRLEKQSAYFEVPHYFKDIFDTDETIGADEDAEDMFG